MALSLFQSKMTSASRMQWSSLANKRRFSREEVMGLLQTEESDCKMALDYESDSDSAPEDDILEGDRSEEGGD